MGSKDSSEAPPHGCRHLHSSQFVAMMISRAARPAFKAGMAAAAARPTTLTVSNAAGYATLREIEGRLKSIRNIEKITKTMKVVASTKLTRAQRAMTESRKYGQTSNTVFESAETKPIEGEGKKNLIIVCSSDKGLCGGIHSGRSGGCSLRLRMPTWLSLARSARRNWAVPTERTWFCPSLVPERTFPPSPIPCP